MKKCGIDIGGTNIKFGIFEEGRKPYFFQIKTPTEKELFIDTIVSEIKSRYKLSDIIGYTVAIPGVLTNGVVAYAPNTNIVGLPLESMLKSRLENDNVIIENDANLQALAEAKASSLNDLIFLSIGTGLGGGIILDGKLLNKNGYAGEVGHIKVSFGRNARTCGCGKVGCAEAYVSCKAIVKEYNETLNTNINSKDLIDLAKKGDKLARKCVYECAKYAAITIADIVATLGVKEVHIGGGLSNAGEYYLHFIRTLYKKYCVNNMENIKIIRANLKYEAGVYAANYLL